MADGGWTRGELRARCTVLREALAATGTVPAELIASFWPKGAANPYRGLGGWIYCFANLGRLHGEDRVRRELAKGTGGEEDLLGALRQEPVPVELVHGAPLACHPKSYEALRWLARDDRLLGAILEQLDRLPVPRSAADQDLADRAVAATIGIQLRMCWAATHPGPGLPYDPLDESPLPPPAIQALAPTDILAVLRAYRIANLRGLSALPVLEEAGKGGTWSTFFATMAQDTGIPGATLMRERPLNALIVEARLARGTRREVA